MATKDDISIWEEHNKKYFEVLEYGALNGLVKSYDEEFLSALREYYCGCITVPILLLGKKLVNGYCYDRAPLVALAFGDDDYNVVCADIDDIRLNPEYIDAMNCGKLPSNYANHCYVERFDGDTTWVYDTTIGLIFEKSLYEELENPKEVDRYSKDENNEYFDEYVTKRFNKTDAGVASLNLFIIGDNLVPVQDIYKETLDRELELFKRKIEDVKIKKKV